MEHWSLNGFDFSFVLLNVIRVCSSFDIAERRMLPQVIKTILRSTVDVSKVSTIGNAVITGNVL